jgi:glycosyltransferase domain-containing protein
MPSKADAALTIVLTLKDRPEFTRRWMRFMNDRRCPYRILIADGGSDKAIETELASHGGYPNLDYEYIRYPFDKSWPEFYAKQLDVCSRVATKYLVFADNDDFFFPDRFAALIEFLEANPDYSGCRGAIAQFSLLSKSGEPVNAAEGVDYVAARHEARSIEDEAAVDRVVAYFKGLVRFNHQINWYCVTRADSMVRTLAEVKKRACKDVVLNEILVLLGMLREGKVKVMEQLSYLRQVGSSQAEAGILVEKDVLELFLINDAFHQFNEFITATGLVAGEEERVRVMTALAGYVGEWSSTCSDRYRTPTVADRVRAAGRRILKRNRTLFRAGHWALVRFSHIIAGTRRIDPLRLPEIEPYILAPR